MSKQLPSGRFYELFGCEPACCEYLGTKYCPVGKDLTNADRPCLNEGMFGDRAAGCARVAVENERRKKEGKLAEIL